MTSLETFVGQLYGGQERLTRDEIQRRAVVADLPTETMAALDALPEGEYAHDEVTVAILAVAPLPPAAGEAGDGVPPALLDGQDLLRELGTLHRTRHDTFRHGSDHALARHNRRTAELESEYLRRFPEREIDPERERAGARQERA